MNDRELETLLRSHYRAIDPTVAPRDLGVRVDEALISRTGRWTFLGRMPALAAGVAAVAVIAILAASLMPGIITGPAAPSPTATPSASPSPSAPVTPSPAPAISLTPAATLPGGSVPPVSTETWATLDLQPLVGGPQAGQVVAWPGGYLALGVAPGAAWVSTDGRTWTVLPGGTFGDVTSVVAAPLSDGIAVLAVDAAGRTTAWRSTDGLTWTESPAPALRLAGATDVAGGPAGLVAITESAPYRLAVSADGTEWHTASLPGPGAASAQGVAAFGNGFVAVGDSGTASGSPVAWWSPDGVTWNLAQVPEHPGDGFAGVHSGATGLVATSQTRSVPGVTTYWISPDGGRSWQLADDPLGIWQQGEGAGSANGLFSGDGTRLLGYGIRADGQPTEYWTSTNATDWTRLALTGDTAAAVAGDVTPMLLRDGVLFAGSGGTWFGAAP